MLETKSDKISKQYMHRLLFQEEKKNAKLYIHMRNWKLKKIGLTRTHSGSQDKLWRTAHAHKNGSLVDLFKISCAVGKLELFFPTL